MIVGYASKQSTYYNNQHDTLEHRGSKKWVDSCRAESTSAYTLGGSIIPDFKIDML